MDFQYPFFYNYPPYFTIQPVQETREKQLSLWCSLVLAYCKHHKVYVLSPSEDNPLFNNTAISRKLSKDGIVLVLDALVAKGSAEWLDKPKAQCLIYWRKVEEWADAILSWARAYGMQDSVVTVDELSSGDDVRHTELERLDVRIIHKALKVLEARGKVALFKGATPGEEGVKFLC